MALDRFEELRGPRRAHDEMRMPAYIRHNKLRDEWNVSTSTILQASKDVDDVRQARMKTARKAEKQILKEERIKIVLKKMKKAFKRKKDEMPAGVNVRIVAEEDTFDVDLSHHEIDSDSDLDLLDVRDSIDTDDAAVSTY
jgi:hypothetical protein